MRMNVQKTIAGKTCHQTEENAHFLTNHGVDRRIPGALQQWRRLERPLRGTVLAELCTFSWRCDRGWRGCTAVDCWCTTPHHCSVSCGSVSSSTRVRVGGACKVTLLQVGQYVPGKSIASFIVLYVHTNHSAYQGRHSITVKLYIKGQWNLFMGK